MKAPVSTIDVPFESKGKQLAIDDPHTVKFENSINHVGEFQSMEVQTKRDGILVYDIGLYSFHHTPRGQGSWVTFQYTDEKNCIKDHEYKLFATLHFLT